MKSFENCIKIKKADERDRGLESMRMNVSLSECAINSAIDYDKMHVKKVFELVIEKIFDDVFKSDVEDISYRKWKINNIVNDSSIEYVDYLYNVIKNEGHNSLLYLGSPYTLIRILEKSNSLSVGYRGSDTSFSLRDIPIYESPVVLDSKWNDIFISFDYGAGISNIALSEPKIYKNNNLMTRKVDMCTDIGYRYQLNDFKLYRINFQ
jgi:hypothetical protein